MMEPVRVNPFIGTLDFFGAMARGEHSSDVHTTNIGDTVIDTCLPPDTRIYETGIHRKIEGKWLIVEQYPDGDTAKAGHKKWVKIITEYPDFPLKDIDNWGLDELKGV
jgi:hypothetical protein